MSQISLFLDTKDSIYTTPADALFNIKTQGKDLSFNKIALKSVVFVNGRTNINNTNQTLVFQEDGVDSDITSTLTAAQYTATELATEIKVQMDADGANTYTVTYNSSTFKFLISTSGTSVKLISSNALYTLGFSTADTAFASSLTSDLVVRLDGTQYLQLCSSIHSTNISSSNWSNVWHRIPVSVAVGELVVYEVNTLSFAILGQDAFKNLSIRLFDDQNKLFINPANCNLTYEFILST